MKALEVLSIYLVPFLVLSFVARHFLNKRVKDVDLPNVREQAGAPRRSNRVSFFGRMRE